MKYGYGRRRMEKSLGAYLKGGAVTARSSRQDDAGGQKNDGVIFIHGLSGGTAGYAVRGRSFDTEGNRAGIQMSANKNRMPVIAAAREACSGTGEYQAGGLIHMLGLLFHNAPVFRFFKMEMRGAESPHLNEPQGEPLKPIWLISRGYAFPACFGVDRVFDHLLNIPTPQVKFHTNSCIHVTARGVLFYEG